MTKLYSQIKPRSPRQKAADLENSILFVLKGARGQIGSTRNRMTEDEFEVNAHLSRAYAHLTDAIYLIQVAQEERIKAYDKK